MELAHCVKFKNLNEHLDINKTFDKTCELDQCTKNKMENITFLASHSSVRGREGVVVV